MGCPVLVVDDNGDMRETIASVLEGEGYAVQQASSGGRALEILRASTQPMVVVLDYMMPDDGGSVLEALREDTATGRRHAYILCTALGPNLPPRDTEALAALGGTVLLKPFDLQDLFDSVHAACRRLDFGE